MRLDGALEPRHGAATLQGRFIGVANYRRRETRVKCDQQQQQQQCADEDDEAAAAAATAEDAKNNNNNRSDSNNCRWAVNEQQARHFSPSQAPSIVITTTTATIPQQTTSKTNLHLRIKGVTPTAATTAATAATAATTTTAATLKNMRVEQSLMLMDPKRIEVDGHEGIMRKGGILNMGRLHTYVLCLISVVALLPPLALADDGNNFFAVNSFSVGPETTTPEFDYASRGQKKFGDKCDNTLECGFPGSICDPKKKSCQCTEDLHVTNHFDKCGKPAAINESCFFNEQCEAIFFQTECRDGRCICRFDMLPIWGKDGSVDCQGRQDKGPERYLDPAMIGVLVGMALMFIIICVVLRLFSQARWHDNRTIFNTPNPRLMNVSLLRDSKLLHGQERRGSRMSVRAPSRQPSMASLRPHSPNPSLGKTGSQTESPGSATSVRSNRSNSVAPIKVSHGGHHERHGSAHRQQQHHHSHLQPQLQSPQEEALITNITTNPVAESVTVEIIEPGNTK